MCTDRAVGAHSLVIDVVCAILRTWLGDFVLLLQLTSVLTRVVMRRARVDAESCLVWMEL